MRKKTNKLATPCEKNCTYPIKLKLEYVRFFWGIKTKAKQNE